MGEKNRQELKHQQLLVADAKHVRVMTDWIGVRGTGGSRAH